MEYTDKILFKYLQKPYVIQGYDKNIIIKVEIIP